MLPRKQLIRSHLMSCFHLISWNRRGKLIRFYMIEYAKCESVIHFSMGSEEHRTETAAAAAHDHTLRHRLVRRVLQPQR